MPAGDRESKLGDVLRARIFPLRAKLIELWYGGACTLEVHMHDMNETGFWGGFRGFWNETG